MKRLPIDWRRVAIIAGVIFLVLLVVDFNARLDELNRLNKQAEIVRADATYAAQTQIALEIEVTYAASDQAVEDYARENHLKQENDVPVVIVGEEGAPPIATPEIVPTPTPQPNWKEWWDLFFGDK